MLNLDDVMLDIHGFKDLWFLGTNQYVPGIIKLITPIGDRAREQIPRFGINDVA